MAGGTSDLLDSDDAGLLSAVRAGERTAFRVLRQRHEEAALRLAHDLVASSAEADDIVGETFARVLDALERGGGPADGFRPYLLTAVRRVARLRLAGPEIAAQTDPLLRADPGRPFLEPIAANPDRELVVRAYMSLPERWRALLWHTDVEQERPDDVAPLFGLSVNGLIARVPRAREAFRENYLELYTSSPVGAGCRSVAWMFGAYMRHALSEAESSYVSQHLSECDDCHVSYSELSDVGATLRELVAPVFLGGAAGAYLSDSGYEFPPGTAVQWVQPRAMEASGMSVGDSGALPLGPTGRMTPGKLTAVGGAAAGGAGGSGGFEFGRAGRGGGSRGGGGGSRGGGGGLGPAGHSGGSRPWRASLRQRWLIVGFATMATAAIGIPLALGLARQPTASGASGPGGGAPAASSSASSPGLVVNTGSPSPKPSHGSPRPDPSPQRSTPSASPTTPSASPSPRASPSPSTRSPSPTASPSPTPKPSPKGPAKLAASVGVIPGDSLGTGSVNFSVTDTGGRSTGEITVTITLPSGASMSGSGGGGWSCQATSSGAACQHSGISAGKQASGGIQIKFSGTADCGKTVSLKASSGSASTSAQSPLACDS